MKAAWELYNGQINDLRQKGATLQQIGDKIGRSRERVRQILVEHYGDTKIENLITTRELCKLAGCERNSIQRLLKKDLIVPAIVDKKRYLWNLETVSLAIKFKNEGSRRCEICGKPIIVGKRCEEHNQVKLTCYICGKEFSKYFATYNRDLKHYSHFFCSRRCFGKYIGANFGFVVNPPKSKYDYGKIYEMANEGCRGIDISNTLNILPSSIYGILKKGGYTCKRDKPKYKELILMKYEGGKMEKYPYEAKIVKKEERVKSSYEFLVELLDQLQEDQLIRLKVPNKLEARNIACNWRYKCKTRGKVATAFRQKKDDFYLVYLGTK